MATTYRRTCKSGDCNKLSRNVGKNKHGQTIYDVLCKSCHKNRMKNKTLKCQYPGCDFVAKHSVQIHIDHKDGNKRNNNPDNLWCICANCHALKTAINHDYRNQYE